MTPSWQREKGPFTAGIKDTLQVLRKELNALRARSIVLQIAIKPAQLRLDGLPRAGASAEHPGVILAFNSSRGPLRIWFDKFTLWERNLRAIALHLEHLRMATLYGVGEDGQAYRGWTAIPGAPAAQPAAGSQSKMDIPIENAPHAARLLWAYSRKGFGDEQVREVLASVDAAKRLIREALAINHPDGGGNARCFIHATRAAEVLKKHHGL